MMEQITLEQFQDIKVMWDEANDEEKDEFLGRILAIAWPTIKAQKN